MVTHSAALVVVGASPPAAAARRQIATNASPRRWSEERRSGQSGVGFGADSGPSIGLQDFLALGVQPQPVLGHPVVIATAGTVTPRA